LDWTVSFDKETKLTNALLSWLGKPAVSVKVNAGLTVLLKSVACRLEIGA
jgi:hypothetical protein